jgi:NAD(P)-dependent dehydrogenase (short-subunit alcohol dehydrogenase family)
VTATVFITGASSGIGRETARYFSEKGWNVVATMRHPESRKTGLESLANIELLHLDVLDRDSINTAVTAALAKYGTIDALVNNAGYAAFGPFEASTPDAVERQFHTNVTGLMDVTRTVLPIFRKQGHGIIVNVSSAAGRMTFPLYSLYNSTKWAVEGFSECLAFELRPFNIRVKIIEPGIIKTDFYDRSKDASSMKDVPAYNALVEKMAYYEDRNMKKGNVSEPRVVAKTIYTAATDGSWKLRYHSGKFSGTILGLRRVLPERAFFRMIRYVTLR